MIISFATRNIQFLTFAVIGVVNTFMHGGVLVMAVERFNAPVVLANLIAFCVANLFSYFMNSWFTFKSALSVVRYLRFLVASMLSLGFTLLLAWLTDSSGFHYLVGFLLIVVFVPMFSFVVMKLWAFAEYFER